MNASPITKITSLLEFLGKNLHLVGCATACGKSEVMLGNNWSDYKHGQTKKLFLAVNPWGCATVVSKLADGSMSDREITKRCGFLKKKKIKGKTVLADRGFQIEDLILAKGGKLVIPPFLAGRKKFTYKELVRSRIITRARIHIERFNQRLKLYKFIGDKIPYYKLDIIDEKITRFKNVK